MLFELIYYTLPDGSKPVEDFILTLNPKMQAKAILSLELLENLGNAVREPYSSPIGNGLFELRIKFASDITRIFYFFCVGNRIVLTNGFIKKSQKTPKKEIELARKYKVDYERRRPHD